MFCLMFISAIATGFWLPAIGFVGAFGFVGLALCMLAGFNQVVIGLQSIDTRVSKEADQDDLSNTGAR